MKKYSSKPETKKHIENVSKLIMKICAMLMKRAIEHDESKLKAPELKYFDKYTPLLKKLKYGSKEYQDSLDALKPALEHHYTNNRHHPEHFMQNVSAGASPCQPIASMNLIDIIEMFCDWMAASKRTKDGDPNKSIKISCERFGIRRPLEQVFYNTLNDSEFYKTIKRLEKF